MPIAQYTGKTLLDEATIAAIRREADALVANKDVAGAWQSANHIKVQLESVPKEQLGSSLDAYRAITAKLKALALPLLSKDDVSHLLEHNLEFLDTRSESLLVSSMQGWLASQPEDSLDAVKAELAGKVDRDAPSASGVLALLDEKHAAPKEKPKAPVPQKDDVLDATELADVSPSAPKAEAVLSGKASTDAEAESISRHVYSLAGSRESEEAFARRAAALVKSRLRDVRSAAELADYAVRPFAAGGLGLSGESLDRALIVIENAYNRAQGVKTNQPHTVIARPNAEAISSTNKKPVTDDTHQRADKIASVALNQNGSGLPRNDKGSAQKEIDTLIKSGVADSGLSDLLKGKPSASAKPSMPQPASYPAKASRPAPELVPSEAEGSTPQRGPSPTTKPRLDDVKPAVQRQPAASRVSGLADELATITLADFRSLGGAAPILGKIKTLEDDSIAAKLAGIAQFRQSPLFGAYLAIGDSALSGGRKLAGALADASINPDSMTEEEFFAIADLNSKLK